MSNVVHFQRNPFMKVSNEDIEKYHISQKHALLGLYRQRLERPLNLGLDTKPFLLPGNR